MLIQLTKKSGGVVMVNPIHIVSITDVESAVSQPKLLHTEILLTAGVRYNVKQSPAEINRLIQQALA